MLIFAALFVLAHTVYGQTTATAVAASTLTSGSPTASSTATTWKISVGNDFKFQPDVTQASVGDIIEFDFMPPNHSVVRAEWVSALLQKR
jgi:plastocyanin